MEHLLLVPFRIRILDYGPAYRAVSQLAPHLSADPPSIVPLVLPDLLFYRHKVLLQRIRKDDECKFSVNLNFSLYVILYD